MKLDQGATFGFTFVIYTDAAQTQPRNLTGFTARMAIRKFHTKTSVLWENLSLPITAALAGEVAVRIEADVTKTFDPGTYVFDIETRDSLGTVERVIEGKIEVAPEVTR